MELHRDSRYHLISGIYFGTVPKVNYKGTRLPVLDIYNLTDKLERDDNVIKAYRKSLLFLVSNALERKQGKPIRV